VDLGSSEFDLGCGCVRGSLERESEWVGGKS
jgi:hypothetical protein